MERRKVWHKKEPVDRTGSHAVVPNGYELVEVRRLSSDITEKRLNNDPASRFLLWLVRRRWQLAPWVGALVALMAGATSPVPAAAVYAGLCALTQWSATKWPEAMPGVLPEVQWLPKVLWGRKLPRWLRGRKWLSRRERFILSYWAAGAGIWCLLVAGAVLTAWSPLGVGILLGVVVVQSLQWSRSRRVRRVKPSELAKRVSEAWPMKMATEGPGSLKGSVIAGMRELDGGTLVLTIQLAAAVHSSEALGAKVREYIERTLDFGVGTVQTEPVHHNSGQIETTLTPNRHLEKVDAPWDGPVVHDNGEIELAVTESGKKIRMPIHDDAGAKHYVIVGGTGGGKTVTSGTVIVPGAYTKREVVWYADGGRGSSAPYLARACDWWATSPEECQAMIRTAMQVSLARQTRRAARGLSRWRGAQEEDPIVRLVFDEATAVKRWLPDEYLTMVSELADIARKLGIGLGQITQDALSERWIGGRDARDQMSVGGTVIAHKVGSSTASLLATTASSEPIDLRRLPKRGWAYVIRGDEAGETLTRCRVRNATEEQVKAVLEGFTPRSLAGQDLLAAGEDYRNRVRGLDAARAIEAGDSEDGTSPPSAGPLRVPPVPMMIPRQVPQDAMAPVLYGIAQAKKDGAERGRDAALQLLRQSGSGLRTGDVADTIGVSERTAQRYLRTLEEAEKVTYDEAARSWSAVQEALSA